MKIATLKLPHNLWSRGFLLLAGMATLMVVYMFQRINAAVVMGELHPNVIFIVNRAARLVLNDLACFLIIWALFRQRNYLKLAFWVFLAELLVILPLYFAIKLSLEGDSEISSPLLSAVHRLIIHPTLMILLMAGFFYQRFRKKGYAA